MPRLDESPEPTFNNVDGIIRIQAEANALLDKFFAFQSSRVNEMLEIFRASHSIINAEPELYDLLNAAFGKSSKYLSWVNSLDPAEQANVTMSLIQPIESDVYTIKLGKNNPIELGTEEDGFETREYIKRTQSKWLNAQLKVESDKDKIRLARKIEAFFRAERVCICKSATLRVLLTQYLNDPDVRTKHKDIIKTCLTLLDKHKDAYNNLNLHALLSPNKQPLTQLITKLCEKYQSMDYMKYHKSMENLIPLIRQVEALGDKYPTLPSRDELIHAAQTIMTRPEQSAAMLEGVQTLIEHEFEDEMSKEYAEINQALSTAQNRVASFNALLEVDNIMFKRPLQSAQRREAALRAIILSESRNEFGYTNDTNQAAYHRSAYLESLLTEAFPEVFQKINDLFEVVRQDSSLDIYKALGQVDQNGQILLQNTPLIEPDKFNFSELSRLHQSNSSNPVWSILTMIKPVDSTFTVNDKINACVDVIRLINTGEIKLNNTPPVEQTRLLADELIGLIKTPANSDFPVEQQIRASLKIIKLIKSQQLKIDDKPAIKQAEDIAKFALGVVDKHRVYSPEITQLFIDIQKETELPVTTRILKKITGDTTAALDQDQQSVQRQLRGFLKGKRVSNVPLESDTDSMHSDESDEEHKPHG